MLVRKAGTAIRSHFGMNWDNSSQCRSRGANSNNSALNLNSNNAGRGVTETRGQTPRLAVSAWSKDRIHDGDFPGLVGQPDAQGSFFS
jgi:hypothetical protein